MAEATAENQRDVLDFLGRPTSYPACPESVERIDTHAAIVFLAGDEAYKVKRAVRLAYLDFSSLAARHSICLREVDLNRMSAPDLYLGVVPITRSSDGTLAIDGDGKPVEWAIRMRRFGQDQLFDHLARHRQLTPALLRRLADEIARAHERAPVKHDRDGRTRMAAIVAQIRQALEPASPPVPESLRHSIATRLSSALDTCAPSLDLRARAGFVRRCHGDLHLKNIVLVDGAPVLFDALEFDEELATVDVLYDLAFLLMDLMQYGMRAGAHLVLDRYLQRTSSDAGISGLAALPLFLACRAGVRALVALDRSRQVGGEEREAAERTAVTHLRAALGYLTPPPARLVAVGGLSGTGKTTVARSLAPRIGAAPGALHLRSDIERKAILGVGETERLSPDCYTPESAATVYETLMRKTRATLRTGHSVVADAVFAKPDERAAIAEAAQRMNVPFVGLWLTAPPEVMKERVAARTGDASDATPEVVERQLAYATGPISWVPIDTSGPLEATLREARRVLARRLGALA